MKLDGGVFEVGGWSSHRRCAPYALVTPPEQAVEVFLPYIPLHIIMATLNSDVLSQELPS
jgi:hypothetical protein